MGTEVQGRIVDRAMHGGHFQSYAEMARRLGVTPATLSQWRSGTARIPEKRLEQLCKLSGDDIGIWAIALMAEETNVVSLRDSIKKVLKDTGRMLPVLLLVMGGLTLPSPASANSSSSSNAPGLYIMSIRRWLRVLFRSPASFSPIPA